PIVPVVDPVGREEISKKVPADVVCYADHGVAINSGEYDGQKTADLKQKISADVAPKGFWCAAVNYKLRDWLFSRQHFWGEPFPIWHELGDDGKPTGLMRTDAESELPVPLPEMRHFKPHGRPEPPLEEAPREWLFKTAPDGTKL